MELSGEIETFIESLADAIAHNAKSPMARMRESNASFIPPIFGDAGRRANVQEDS